jgi:hypothetical protein
MTPTDSTPSFGVVKAPLTPAPNVTNWSLLKDTYWIVVSEYTPAYELQGNSLGTIGLPKTDPPTITRILDQTVYYIQDVDPLGYLWGYVGVTLVDPSWDKGSHPQTTYGTLLSPITPAGDWILSTTVNQGNTALQEPSQTWATGKMAWMNVDGVDQWTMENWKVGGYVHWAYMIQSKPGDEYWDSLPVTNQSIPEFLAPAKASWEPVNPVPYPVFDTNPPQISSITTEGKTVILEFTEAVQARYVLSSAFTVATVSSTNVITSIAVNSASLNPNNLSQVILTLAEAAPASTVDLRVSYTDPVGNQTSGVIQDLTGNDAASFSIYADPATLYLSALSADKAEGNIGSTPFTFAIQRDGDPSAAVSVAWTVTASGVNPADALDFAGSAFPSGVANLAAGQTSQQITLNVVGDGSFEADETFTLSLSNPLGGSLVPGAATAYGRIQNDDVFSAPVYTFSKSADAVDEGSALAIGISTANAPIGSPLYWRFGGTDITAADFSDGLLEGSTVLGSDGRAGFSKAIATDPDSNPTETLELRFFRDAARTQQVGSTVSVLLRQPSVGLVTDASDILTGTSEDETLRGVPTGSTLRGMGSLDRLTGGGGNDQFVLGDAIGRFYDDGTPGLGSADLALITDFTSDNRIQLHGLASDYRLISGRYAGVSGVRIDALSPTPEAIGFVQGSTLASLSLANPSQFVFV